MKAQKEHIQLFVLIQCLWILLYLTTVLSVMTFGEFGTYQSFFYFTGLLGTSIGLAGLSKRAKGLRDKIPPKGFILCLQLLLFVFLVLIGSKLYGYPNGLNTALTEVLQDNSLGMYKGKFLESEALRQFGVPIFITLMFSWVVVAFVPIGERLKELFSSSKSEEVVTVVCLSSVMAWIVTSIVSALPFGLTILAFVIPGLLIYAKESSPKVTALSSAGLIVASICCYSIPASGIASGASFNSVPMIKSMFNTCQRLDFYPLISENKVAAIVTELNHQNSGVTLSPELTRNELEKLKDKYEKMENMEVDDFDLPYHLIEDPKKCNLLIVGPYPSASILAALKFGFEKITVVSRRNADIEPVKLLLNDSQLKQVNFVVDDGFKFFRNTKMKFDLINFSGRYDKQSINSMSILGFDDTLYSFSSFTAARKLLSKNGYIAVPYGFGFPVLNKLAKTMKRSVGHFVLHFAARGGGYILAASKDSELKIDPKRLSSLKETFGSNTIKDPKALEEKRQLKTKSSWTLNSPFLHGFNSVLDMGHLAALTIVSIVAIFAVRLIGPLSFLKEKDYYLVALLSAAMTCLIGKAMTVYSLWNGTTDFCLAFNQVVPWLPLAFAVILLRVKKSLPLNLILFPALFLVGISKVGLIASKGYWYSNLPVTFLMQLIPITCIASVLVMVLAKCGNSTSSISAMLFGIAFGFIFTLGAYFGGLTQLDSIVFILLVACFITIRRRAKEIAV